jgi:hypothetical protein
MSTTTTDEVPRDQWPFFFNTFSCQHEGWLVTVEVLASDIGAQVEAKSLRFEGISADHKDGEDSIAITLGESADAHITHIISSPTHVRIERSEIERGTFETLEIESADGATTLVRFLAGVVPEMLDDIR